MHIQELQSALLSELERLAEAGFGYRLRHARDPSLDLLVEIQRDGNEWIPLAIQVCRNPRRGPVRDIAEQARKVAAPLGAVPVVGLPRIGPGLRQFLRELGVGYVSADGQIYIRGPGILIDREPSQSPNKLLWEQRGNPFADKSSLLLRHLFSQAEVSSGVVDLSDRLGISPGLVSRLLSRLRSEGYVVEEDSVIKLADREALLDDWRDLYRRRAKRQRQERFYMHARDVASVIQRLVVLAGEEHLPRWGLSFQAGASLVAPYAFFSEVHVLLDPMSWDRGVSAFSHRLRLEPARHEANVVVVEPYYKRSWQFGLRQIDGLPVVSDLQLFLDLSVYPRRGEEQASRIRERLLAA